MPETILILDESINNLVVPIHVLKFEWGYGYYGWTLKEALNKAASSNDKPLYAIKVIRRRN